MIEMLGDRIVSQICTPRRKGTVKLLGILSFLTGLAGAGRLRAAKEEARRVLQEAEEQKRQTLIEAREEALEARSSVEDEVKESRKELQRLERRHSQREETLDRKSESLERQESSLADRQRDLEAIKEYLKGLKEKQLKQLESVAQLTTAEAKEMLFKKSEDEMKHDLARRYRELERNSKEEADQNARKVITTAIHRLASDVVAERTTSTVSLPNDDMKGRLIGREGRNIKVLEALTGVDIIIDDTPEVVTISCFDPVRKETARLALENLVRDGRIQPARIEDMVVRAQKEMDEIIAREGERGHIRLGRHRPGPRADKAPGSPEVPL